MFLSDKILLGFAVLWFIGSIILAIHGVREGDRQVAKLKETFKANDRAHRRLMDSMEKFGNSMQDAIVLVEERNKAMVMLEEELKKQQEEKGEEIT